MSKVTLSLILLMILLLAACSSDEKKDPTDQPEATPVAVIIGNPERGAEIFANGVEGAPPCAACHSIEPKPSRFTVAPNLQGVYGRTGNRMPTQTPEEYLTTSILRPGAYVVDGFNDAMYSDYAVHLSSQDVSDLIAFLLTL